MQVLKMRAKTYHQTLWSFHRVGYRPSMYALPGYQVTDSSYATPTHAVNCPAYWNVSERRG